MVFFGFGKSKFGKSKSDGKFDGKSGGKADPRIIRGVVFSDINGNGIFEGEGGFRDADDIENVLVTLRGAGADGQFGTDDDIVQTDRTNRFGQYAFTNLSIDKYQVFFTELRPGFTFTTPNVGNDVNDSDVVDFATGATAVIDLNGLSASDPLATSVNAGIVPGTLPPLNQDPDAVDDVADTGFNSAITINVLGNDSDPDGDAISLKEIASGPANGRVEISGDQIIYIPNGGFIGEDTFSYTIADGQGGHDTAQVRVNVNAPVNNAPDAVNDAASTAFNTPVEINVLGNDSDPDGNPLAVTSIDGVAVNPGDTVDVGNGTVTVLNNGQLSFTPDAGFTGDETFSYHVSDGNGGEDTANVTVNVGARPNTAPDAVDDTQSTPFNTPVQINVLGNDSDPDGDPLAVTSVDGVAVNPGDTVDVGNGTVVVLANGQLGFIPDAGFSGDETFTYHVSDGNGGEDTANVTVTVDGPLNSSPDAVDDSQSTPFNTPVAINVLGNDSDPDGDPLAVTSVDGVAVNPGDTIDVGNGTVTVLNNGQLSFTPDAGFTGDETFTYHVSDGNGGEDTANVTVTVDGPLNSSPDAVDDSQSTPFNTPVQINVLGNDSDPDGDPLAVTSVDGVAVNPGDTVDVGNGTVVVLANGQLGFIPDAGFSGDETFTYHVSDGNGGEDTANVTVTVDGPLNSSPDAVDDAKSTPFNTPVDINVLGNDSDPDGDPLSVTSVDGNAVNPGDTVDVGNGTVTVLNNGQLSFTPDAGFTGDETFTYHVSDGNGGEDTANVTVTVDGPLNSSPDAVDDSQSTPFNTPVAINVLGNDSDPDGDPLAVTSVDGVAVNPGDTIDVGNGTVTVLNNGQLSFTPDAGFTGDETFTYHVSDGNGGEDTANVTVTVDGPLNSSPDAVDDSQSTPFNTPVQINVLGNDSDPDGDPLAVTSVDGVAVNPGDTVDVGNGTVVVLANGQLGFIPDAGFSGDETFTYHVSDGNGGEDTANVTVTVDGPLNSSPDAVDDAKSTPFNTPVDINVLGNDSDPDGDPLSVTSVDGNAVNPGDTVDVGNGTVTVLNNGQLSFTPDAGFTGDETFTYHVSDGNGGEDTANVTVTVDGPLNSSPDAVDDAKSTPFNTPVAINVLGNDSDPDGDSLAVTSVDGVAVNPGDTIDVGNGTVTVLNNGQLSFTPDAGFTGDETFTYHVSDGNGGEDTANVTVTVDGPLNSSPDAVDDSQSTPFNTPVQINVLGNDSDPDGDPLAVTSVDGVAVNPGDTVDVGDGTVTLLNNGQLSFTPDDGFTGDETFSYHVSDGNGGEDTANVTVTVENNVEPAELGNQVFFDANGDGRNTSRNESGIGGVTVNLWTDDDGNGTPDTQIDSLTTSRGGFYRFRNLDPSLTYVVQFVNPDTDAFDFTLQDAVGDAVDSDADPTTGFTDPINLAPGEINITVDAGFVAKAPDNGEPDAKDDSAQTPFDTPVTVDVLANDTDPDGDPLTIKQIEANPSNGTAQIVDGKIVYTPNAGFEGNDTFEYTIADGNGGHDTAAVTIMVEPDIQPIGSISGQVRNDVDGDGDLSDPDAGIVGVTIKLFEDNDGGVGADGPAIATTTTDANGNYSFGNVAQGQYIVDQVNLPGFISTADANGGNLDRIDGISIVGNQSITGRDFLDTAQPTGKMDIVGTPGDDFLKGTNEGDNIFGQEGRDNLFGAAGDDCLFGGAGNDVMIGGNGNDILSGTDGTLQGTGEKDVFVGGKGSDTFVLGDAEHAFYAAQGFGDSAWIVDFNPSEDKVQLWNSPDLYEVKVVNGHSQLFCKAEDGKSSELIAYFANNANVDITSSAFEYV